MEVTPPLWQRLEEAIAQPGGLDRAIAAARRLGLTLRDARGKASVRLTDARGALLVAQDTSEPQEARQMAALACLLGLSCAAFWRAPSGSCHEEAAAFDARLVAAMERG